MVVGPILMIGDSITDAGRPRDSEGLGHGWVMQAADALHRRGVETVVLNRGIGGDRVADLRARWSRDVVDLAPSVLTVHIGINDVASRYDGGRPVPLGSFAADYRANLADAQNASSPGVIVMEPFLACAVDDPRFGWHLDLDPIREVVARLAEEVDAIFVPLQSLVDGASARHGAQAVALDGIHPSPLGEELIASAWLNACDRLCAVASTATRRAHNDAGPRHPTRLFACPNAADCVGPPEALATATPSASAPGASASRDRE